jgi:GntR family transcriptional regulator, rspAB operon transcriptional repressor
MDENLTTPSLIDLTNINEKIYNYIKKNIAAFHFPPGSKLSTKELSKTLGVSQTPIKDALFRLAGEGLVDITSRAGTYVKSIRDADIHEILQIRLILETAVMEEIAGIITDEQLETLKDLHSKGLSLVVNPNDIESYKAFLEYDSQFHIAFFYILGNARLLHIYKTLNAHMQMVRFRLMNHALGKLPTTDEDHSMILEALCQRHVAKAKQAIINHIKGMEDLCTTVQLDEETAGQRVNGITLTQP